ncbi:hypothetical protein HYFRA_00001457 [Hymenoscyphus fraxineus]|uniref:Uncharacterized protein n=1 Tax=Hymenoscyphus fraxineus TaxID=746836 RepID=A0A9N9PTV4_9HELO|nr:hypothetical protein HYFRA_00001457 [Hymenoscyphus fraxineus]
MPSQPHQNPQNLQKDSKNKKKTKPPSYHLQAYLDEEPTITDHCSGMTASGSKSRGKKTHVDRAAKTIKDFDDACEKK